MGKPIFRTQLRSLANLMPSTFNQLALLPVTVSMKGWNG